MNEQELLRRKKWHSGISIAIIALLTLLLTALIWRWLSAFTQDSLREYIRSFGIWSWLIMLLLQFLQVFVALIPGEFVESAAGYIFGPLYGTLICYAGLACATCLVFCLTRRFGSRLVEVFISREKLRSLRFLNTEKKRDLLIFTLFFIPGTPKDLLTYFAGLTDIPLPRFLALTLLARIPSVVSSTFGGHLLGEENYWCALLLYGISGAVALVGIFIYNSIVKRSQTK